MKKRVTMQIIDAGGPRVVFLDGQAISEPSELQGNRKAAVVAEFTIDRARALQALTGGQAEIDFVEGAPI